MGVENTWTFKDKAASFSRVFGIISGEGQHRMYAKATKRFMILIVFFGIVIFTIVCGDSVFSEVKSVFYTISLAVKDCLAL